jgi:hypothetical protein
VLAQPLRGLQSGGPRPLDQADWISFPSATHSKREPVEETNYIFFLKLKIIYIIGEALQTPLRDLATQPFNQLHYPVSAQVGPRANQPLRCSL